MMENVGRGQSAQIVVSFKCSMANAGIAKQHTLRGKTMSYAISFDLDTEQLKQAYPTPSWQNAYGDIKKILTPLGFDWQQGSVYFGGNINAVQCVLAAQKLSQTYTWFKPSVRDIRMLRIEELNDLYPAL